MASCEVGGDTQLDDEADSLLGTNDEEMEVNEPTDPSGDRTRSWGVLLS